MKPDLYFVKNPTEIKAFALHLRKLRDERGLSQQELADIADIAKKTIQRIETNKYGPTLDVVISISKALKIPLEELVACKKKKGS